MFFFFFIEDIANYKTFLVISFFQIFDILEVTDFFAIFEFQFLEK